MDKIKTYKKFVNDPEWHEMESFILEHLDVNVDVRDIDTAKDSAVIVGQVVARQEQAKAVLKLIDAFKGIRNYDPEKKPEQKKPLK